MNKIYEVEFYNTKYSGESEKRLHVRAGSLSQAIKVAISAMKRSDEFSGKTNWTPSSARLIAETEN